MVTMQARNSAVTGLASGVGGVARMVTIGGVDIVNLAAQLYRLNQRVASFEWLLIEIIT